jgi:hypothetical protein
MRVLARRQPWIGRASGERADDVPAAVLGQTLGQVIGFGGAAEDQQVGRHRLQQIGQV